MNSTLPFSLALLLATGCGNKEPEAPVAATETEAPVVQTASEKPSEVRVVAHQFKGPTGPISASEAKKIVIVPDSSVPPTAAPVVVHLTVKLRQYMEKHGKAPDSVTVLINATMDSAPQAPKGMMYVIDEKAREVRLAKIP